MSESKKVDTNKKGKFLEKIVEQIYKSTPHQVEHNVRIKEIYPSGIKRQFDVVITTEEGNKYYVECKNYDDDEPVGIDKIEEFSGKLASIGASDKQAVFISAKGFRQTVAQRAKERGFQVGEILGLNKEGFGESKGAAYNTKLILLPVIVDHYFYDECSSESKKSKLFHIFSDILDRWKNNEIKQKIGSFDELITITNLKVMVRVQIRGILLSRKGEFFHYTQIESVSKNKMGENLNISNFEDKIDVNVFYEENELKDFINNTDASYFYIIDRIKSPKIEIKDVGYFPISERARKNIKQLKKEGKKHTINEVEGNDLQALFED